MSELRPFVPLCADLWPKATNVDLTAAIHDVWLVSAQLFGRVLGPIDAVLRSQVSDFWLVPSGRRKTKPGYSPRGTWRGLWRRQPPMHWGRGSPPRALGVGLVGVVVVVVVVVVGVVVLGL